MSCRVSLGAARGHASHSRATGRAPDALREHSPSAETSQIAIGSFGSCTEDSSGRTTSSFEWGKNVGLQVKARSLEYPVVNKAQSERNFVFSTRQEILRFAHTYGLFGTFDDSYQPLSPTVKVEHFPLVDKTH
jgi:hypothetical protein